MVELYRIICLFAIVKAYQTEEVYNKANEEFKGAMIKGW